MSDSAPLTVTCAARPLTTIELPLVATLIWSLFAVPLVITVSAAPSPVPLPAGADRSMATWLMSVPERSLTVMVSGAAQHIELDMLDPAEVHRHVADIAEQAGAAAIGRDVDLLGNIGAVEQQRIGAVLAFDDVAAIARIPLKRIVSGAKEGDVTALIAVDEIVSVAADQEVIAGAAEDRVIAAAAIDRELDLPCGERRRVDGVVAAERL